MRPQVWSHRSQGFPGPPALSSSPRPASSKEAALFQCLLPSNPAPRPALSKAMQMEAASACSLCIRLQVHCCGRSGFTPCPCRTPGHSPPRGSPVQMPDHVPSLCCGLKGAGGGEQGSGPQQGRKLDSGL